MTRIPYVLCVCLVALAYSPRLANGQPSTPAGGFDTETLAAVQSEAIDFMVPRTLEPVTARQLTAWGLSGLTTIDPALSAGVRDDGAELLQRGRPVLRAAASGSDSAPWAWATAKLTAAAFAASPAVRQMGQPAVTKVLFDAMLAHIDSYSRYLPPAEASGDRVRRVGQAGIGVTLQRHGQSVTVADVVMGSPGAEAGMETGDVIERVNGRSVRDRNLDGIEAMLNGPEGTAVRLGWSSRDGATRAATLRRVMVPPETVFPRRSGNIEIIEVTGFSETTDQHVIEVVRDTLRGSRPAAGIILDLRGNRGGLLRTAITTAEAFLPQGVIVQTAGRAPETNRIWRSDGNGLAHGVPVVVLVDGATASAAEVLAAALQDRGRAVVVGSSTFGKGVVQTVDPLPDGGELFLTWSRLLAPRGWPIQSLGVMPQICTSQGEDFVHRQLDALAEGTLLMAAAIGRHDAARAPLPPDQSVAIREACPAADPHEADLGVAEALLATPAHYAAALLAAKPGDP